MGNDDGFFLWFSLGVDCCFFISNVNINGIFVVIFIMDYGWMYGVIWCLCSDYCCYY